MINKIFKRIFSKYSNIFKFLIYLNYFFLIFFLTTFAYLIIPKFLNFEDNQTYVKKYLSQNYNLNIKNVNKIHYNIFPVPNFEIKDISINFYENDYKFETNKIIIFPNILKIYNFQELDIKKVSLIDSKLDLKVQHVTKFYKKLVNQKNKISFNNLTIEIINDYKPVITLKKIKYSNYGYKKNKILGEVFKKKFEINSSEKHDKISFKLLKTGIFGEVIYLNNSVPKFKTGKFKAKVLNSNIKFDFNIDKNSLNIANSFFRNKYLSFETTGKINLIPFLNIELISTVKELNKEILYKINIRKLLNNKDFLKRLNTNQEINFSSKRFSRNIINKINAKFSITYGRLVSTKTIFFDQAETTCVSEMNLLEDNPILIFNCAISTNNKKKFLRNFSIDIKETNKPLNLEIVGNLNLYQNKINFLDIKMNKSYQASDVDLKFFKDSFENILLENNLLDLFDNKKINKFMKEIS